MHTNLAAMHRSVSRRLGPRPALRYKRHGLYHDLSWEEYRRQADRAAAGLITLGVQPGDRVAMLSENRPEWLIADHAILSAGAINVPQHAPLTSPQVAYQVGHSGSRGIFVSTRAQADKVFAALDSLLDLEFMVSFDPLGDIPAEHSRRLRLLTWQGLQQRGFNAGPSAFDEIGRREAETNSESLATIMYTSGTTGHPKGVMLTHGNLVSNAHATLNVSEIYPGDTLLSWLPYSHIYARLCDHYLTTLGGLIVALAESIDTLIVNLAEIQPTWLTAVPRFYEKVWTSVEHLPPAERKEKLKKIFGPRLRHLSSGGAPLPRHIGEAFFEAGIPLLEGYGLTESSPVISFNSLENVRLGTVGRPVPGVEVKIAPDGEVLTRGPHVMKGYWKNPQATAETIIDGWLHTGDVGEIDSDGYLRITDRKKDLIITSAGKNIAPSELERLLVSDPYIDQAVVYGDGRKFVSALIAANFPSLEKKAAELGCRIQTADGFITTPELIDFFNERIKILMESVSQPERVKKFLLLDRPFQLESDELTATLKVRRRHIIQKYEAQLAALYDEN